MTNLLLKVKITKLTIKGFFCLSNIIFCYHNMDWRWFNILLNINIIEKKVVDAYNAHISV
jgi:hypothetical protein